ncbi:hypothetical protein A2392_01125 [Candidatus Kaiserbacteria bacterium RIFOXYB1_FULL_46_14]|uniref:Cohesin domain-containing protein n=1 Tax=Candidatus Kaiserbacteria bacterium RIFOXYB1_FULL_46_14 TaxID=1798531 RepID=A0A1F6FJL7_9BACT|nr:MAG: hypothetical protein A2392_01125 [Candidatus Kaiserbacteria bacterium RIFOXYB1_FULL_46_14]
MRLSILKISFLHTLLFAFLLSPTFVQAATLNFSAPKTATIGTEFSLIVQASSTDRGFNAAEAEISFPEDILEVVSVDTTPGSTIFNFWLTPPTFSNEEGAILFSGGTTNGVLGADVPIITVLMRVIGSGSALITANDASINASDGSGSNILEDIIATRLTVPEATILIPPQPTLSEPTPTITKEIVKVPEAPVISEPEEDTRAEVSAKECEGIFFNCDIRFPQIKSVTVLPQKNAWSNIFVAGTVSEGTTVRLVLRHEGDFYKEVTAIVKPDKTWEAIFTNIFSYGTYSVDARTIDEANRTSQPTRWSDINIYPPYTFYLFGVVFRWYIIVSICFGIFTLISGIFILSKSSPKYKGKKRSLVSYIIVFTVIATILAAVTTASFLLWKKEFSPQLAYWKETDVPCIERIHSYSDEYGSAKLEIFIDNELQTIPAELGVSPQCVATIHTHDDTGNLHFELTERTTTLADFFRVTGVALNREGYTLSITINEEDYTDRINTYDLQDKDHIVVTYNKIPL